MRSLIAATAAILLASCFTAPDTLRAWKLPAGEASYVTEEHRLIGFACGKARLTMTAVEEDEFPKCEAIEFIAVVCAPDPYDYEPVEPFECARYWGDGW